MIALQQEVFDSLTPDHADPETVRGYIGSVDGLIEVTVFYRPLGGGDKRRVDCLFAPADIQDVAATDAIHPDFGAGARRLRASELL